MANFNKVILAGNLTREPELRYTPQGSAVLEFGLAVNRSYTDSSGAEREETCFIECNMWGSRGEGVADYLGKGDPVLVEGRLCFETWETREGRRSKHEVVVTDFEFLPGGQR